MLCDARSSFLATHRPRIHADTAGYIIYSHYLVLLVYPQMAGWMPPIGLSPPKTSGNLKDVSPVPAATKAIKIDSSREEWRWSVAGWIAILLAYQTYL
ncbi:hypothetical protein SCLCIDRAFT_340604 [Scleroderma citrinum Foug A]|uniref:Uncharacterized protein n=1 Tax=Scleroderma citrinum Foug A TaxID=1036808 RepID=A0A0C3DEQ4_9AGAM|nr:hypothetical protein SCLCIDRAFT_340604 [Scleroderma citrinum Foug A]